MTDRNDILCGPVDADGCGLNRSAAHSVLLLAACFLIQFLTCGVVFSNGVLLVPLQEHFDTSQITAAWLFSIQMFFYFFSAIYTDWLIRKAGWGLTTGVSSVLTSVGLLLSALPDNIYLMYFTYSIVTGVGTGVMNCISILAVQQHFTKRLFVANGVLTSGWTVGLMVFSPLINSLLKAYDWNTFYILGAIFSASIVTAPLFHYSNKRDEATSHDHVPSNDTSALNTFWTSTHDNSYSQLNKSEEKVTEEDITKQNNRRVNIYFALFLFSFGMFSIATNTILVYVPAKAQGIPGVSSSQASILLTYHAIADLISRTLLTWIGDFHVTAAVTLGSVVLLIQGVFSLFSYWLDTYSLMVFYVVVAGLAAGFFAGTYFSSATTILGVVIASRRLGYVLAFTGAGLLISTPFGAFINEKTDTDYIVFIIYGVVLLIGGMCFGVIAYMWRSQKKTTSG